MFQRLKNIILTFGTAAALAACSDGFDAPTPEPVPDSPGTLTIRLKSSGMSRSDASNTSENLIDNVVLCVYAPGSTDTDAATLTQRYTGLAASGSTIITMYLSDENVQTLFANVDGANCKIFAAANITNEQYASLPQNPSIHDLKNISISSDFKNTDVQLSFVMTGPGDVTYIAPAEGETKGRASGEIKLYRAAAKILLTLDLPASIEIKNGDVTEIWEPKTGNMQVLLNNGVHTAISAPETVGATPWAPNDIDAYYSSTIAEGSCRKFEKNGDRYTVTVPFYTYPNAWTEDIFEMNKTTMTLMVGWGKRGEETWNMYYYQVPVTPANLTHIASNHSYSVTLKVGMLGSLVPDTPEIVTGSYEAVAWGNEAVGVEIKDFRYLVVSPNTIDVQNEAEISIPIYSSHPVDTGQVLLTFQRFNFYRNGNGEVVDITVANDVLQNSTTTTNGTEYKYFTSDITDGTNGQKILTIKHPLEVWNAYNANTGGTEVTFTNKTGTGNQSLANVQKSIRRFGRPTNPDASYSAYTIKVHIQHKDKPAYYEDIIITQYPGMYIKADPNPGNRNTSGTNPGKGNQGNVFVNGGYYSRNNNYALGSVESSLSGNNSNPNMYIITVSQLDPTSGYIIGDPRTEYYNNTLNTTNNADLPTPTTNGAAAGTRANNVNYATNYNWCESSPALYDKASNRTLKYYYPTIESQLNQDKMKIAPKFRVASSWGKTQPMSRNGARRRMATYQELNCPAGRWRLPTYGELQFIISMSNTGKIPVLYSDDKYYWTAQGACLVNKDGTITLNKDQTDNVYCRGVYDEWYWEEYTNYTISPTGNNYTYTLGDIPRNVPNE